MLTTLGNLLLNYHEYFPTDYRDWLQQGFAVEDFEIPVTHCKGILRA